MSLCKPSKEHSSRGTGHCASPGADQDRPREGTGTLAALAALALCTASLQEEVTLLGGDRGAWLRKGSAADRFRPLEDHWDGARALPGVPVEKVTTYVLARHQLVARIDVER